MGCGFGCCCCCCCCLCAPLPPSSSARILSRRDSTPATACDRNEPHRDEDLFGAAIFSLGTPYKSRSSVFLYRIIYAASRFVVVVVTSCPSPPFGNKACPLGAAIPAHAPPARGKGGSAGNRDVASSRELFRSSAACAACGRNRRGRYWGELKMRVGRGMCPRRAAGRLSWPKWCYCGLGGQATRRKPLGDLTRSCARPLLNRRGRMFLSFFIFYFCKYPTLSILPLNLADSFLAGRLPPSGPRCADARMPPLSKRAMPSISLMPGIILHDQLRINLISHGKEELKSYS